MESDSGFDWLSTDSMRGKLHSKLIGETAADLCGIAGSSPACGNGHVFGPPFFVVCVSYRPGAHNIAPSPRGKA